MKRFLSSMYLLLSLVCTLALIVGICLLIMDVNAQPAAYPGPYPGSGPYPGAYLPVLLNNLAAPSPFDGVPNGGFESGRTMWHEYSSNGYMLILSSGNLAGTPPHGGSWAAWLAGDHNEDSLLYQGFTLPTGTQNLRYWLWIDSADYCSVDYDIAGVLINDVALDAFYLCQAMNTGGWLSRTVNVANYAGQMVNLQFAAFTDSSYLSNLYLDDVASLSTAVYQNELSGGIGAGIPEAGLESKPAPLRFTQPADFTSGAQRSVLEAFLRDSGQLVEGSK